MSDPSRIHITGASGAGVSTLGAGLAGRLGFTHLDTDDFYWLPTQTPYQSPREAPERLRLLETALEAAPAGWVLSGSLDGWGDRLIPRFEAVIFLTTATETRLARLRLRERERYGDSVTPGGASHAHHVDFLAYAAAYDTGVFTGAFRGRYLARHETWLASLPCPVVRLDGGASTTELVERAIDALAM
jgi:hypothetical protein